MTDITNTHLEAAILDQVVAGTFGGVDYAFTVVIGDGGFALAVAIANEPGYYPTNKTFETEAEAYEWADGLNTHIGLTATEAARIIVSTMGGLPYLSSHSGKCECLDCRRERAAEAERQRIADRVDGYDRDDLGESEDR